jgi:PAS domain S-box-containing protein
MKVRGKNTILVVDDQIPALQGVSRIIKAAGYESIEASTGEECLKLAAERKPDLVLLDVVLPDIDGREVCRRIKSNPQTSDIYVLLLSSIKIDSENQADGLEHGADGYIARPIPNRELLARIKAMLRIIESEKKLSEALGFTEKILKTSPVGIATFASDGKATLANEAISSIVGATLEEFHTINFRVAEPWKTSGLLDDATEVLSKGGVRKREVHFVTTFGKDVWLDCRLARFKSGNDFNLLINVNDITSQKIAEKEKETVIRDLQEALAKVKQLGGLLPICASCKKIRNDKGYWQQIESYIRDHSEAEFSHSICPECTRKLYPDLYQET